MSLPEGIEPLELGKWENIHQNFTHTFKKHASFKLRLPESAPDSTAKYRATTANFQWLIKYALQNNIQLRAMGSGWSFSDVAISEGGVIDTKSLRLTFNMGKSFIDEAWLDQGKKPENLFFTQCGVSILDLNEKLEKESNPKRSLKASGNSNGQTIAGATSTGTHGGAFNLGAVHDTIVGLHIITGPDTHVWLERSSNPIASDNFIQWLGAELIRDDDAFNAAVVSFGSFGFIHGVLLEVEPIFLLEQHKIPNVPYADAVKKLINQRDFSGIASRLPYPQSADQPQIYHLDVVVNPHSFEPDSDKKGVYLRLMYKLPYRTNYTKIPRDENGFFYGDDTLGLIQKVLDAAGALADHIIPPLVNKLFPLAYAVTDTLTGTVGETFRNTAYRGKLASFAICIDSEHTSKVLEAVIKLNKENPFSGAIGFRFVKGTKALLGFTRFEKSCVMELDGMDSKITRAFFINTCQKLDELGVQFTLHWGKLNYNMTPEMVRKMYGEERINKWLKIRKSLLGASMRVFNNKFLERIGLDKDPDAIV
ncbi:MAG: FAD-binding protein [Sporocytophaga sp.]|uniref:FAD-binding protein n=1 Tax=Sporocytophaga sp. TaxID=2231183 RepID=UPI001B080D6D|nr:FAD-binding protein [Sporocytophaga sp.]MBO9703528.1 FAD-binding protein [Sporocytophaga sp.]